MSYSKLLLKVVVREPIAWVTFGTLAVLLSLCVFLPYPLYGPELLKLTLRMNYESLSESFSNGSFDGAPDDLVESMHARVDYMSLALNAETNQDFYRALSKIYAIDEAQSSSGSLVGTSPLEEVAKKEYADAMAMVDGSVGYDYSNQLPGIPLLTVAPSTLPQFALSIPAIAIAFCISSATDRRKLLGSAAIPAGTSLLSRCLVGVVLSAIGLCAAIIPPFLIATGVRGFGDASYPIVFLRGGQIVEMGVGESALWTLGLMTFTWLFLVVVGVCISALAKNALAGPGVALALSLIPSAPNYYSVNSIWGPTLESLPFSYFCPWVVAGSCGAFPNVDLTPSYSLQPTNGLMVLAGWTILILFISAGGLYLRQRVMRRRGGVPAGNGLSLSDSTIAYGRNVLLSNVSLTLPRKSITGIIAPNGSGKTTLLEVLAGDTRRMREGELSIGGTRVTDEVAYALRVYYSPSDMRNMYPHMSTRFHLEAVKSLWNSTKNVADVVEMLGMESFLDKPCRALSQGMARQASLAMACISGASFVLLDEPLNALDPIKAECAEKCIRWMAAQGSGVVISSHQPEEMDRLCDSFAFLVRGKIERVATGKGKSCREWFESLFATGA
ncbi:MAG: ABC transporter ATP-binding protein [Olsenella sp.]|nr:ABC transporter ATP-binding protein [Olsenella sp.]